MRRFNRILILPAILVILSLPACTQDGEILDVNGLALRMDKLTQDIKTVTEAGEQLLGSPVGQFVPLEIKFWIVLGGALAAGLANGWQGWRSSQMKKTTTAIVRGIEKAESAAPANPGSAVKAAIANEMLKTGCYNRCNEIVDKLKAK